jgi:hypothetical protein
MQRRGSGKRWQFVVGLALGLLLATFIFFIVSNWKKPKETIVYLEKQNPVWDGKVVCFYYLRFWIGNSLIHDILTLHILQ